MITITYVIDRNGCIELHDTYTSMNKTPLSEYLYDVIINFRWLDAIVINGEVYPVNYKNLDRDILRLSLDAIKI